MNRFEKVIREMLDEFAGQLAEKVQAEMVSMLTTEPKVRRKRGSYKKRGTPDNGASDPTPHVKRTRHYKRNPETGETEVTVEEKA